MSSELCWCKMRECNMCIRMFSFTLGVIVVDVGVVTVGGVMGTELVMVMVIVMVLVLLLLFLFMLLFVISVVCQFFATLWWGFVVACLRPIFRTSTISGSVARIMLILWFFERFSYSEPARTWGRVLTFLREEVGALFLYVCLLERPFVKFFAWKF